MLQTLNVQSDISILLIFISKLLYFHTFVHVSNKVCYFPQRLKGMSMLTFSILIDWYYIIIIIIHHLTFKCASFYLCSWLEKTITIIKAEWRLKCVIGSCYFLIGSMYVPFLRYYVERDIPIIFLFLAYVALRICYITHKQLSILSERLYTQR